jgi:hypothetical protein
METQSIQTTNKNKTARVAVFIYGIVCADYRDRVPMLIPFSRRKA